MATTITVFCSIVLLYLTFQNCCISLKSIYKLNMLFNDVQQFWMLSKDMFCSKIEKNDRSSREHKHDWIVRFQVALTIFLKLVWIVLIDQSLHSVVALQPVRKLCHQVFFFLIFQIITMHTLAVLGFILFISHAYALTDPLSPALSKYSTIKVITAQFSFSQ